MLRTVLVEDTVATHWSFHHAIDVPPALPTQAQPRTRLAATHLDLALTLSDPDHARGRLNSLPAQTAIAMNAPLLPEVFVRWSTDAQADLPLASEGAMRWVWGSRFGPMLIEVREGRAFVNGQAVEPVEIPEAAARR